MHLRAAGAALVLLGLITGCTRTTTGEVAMTTEPGAPLSSGPNSRPNIPLPPGITIPNLPLPTRDPSIPDVPAPANALTMTCGEYNKLDQAKQYAVIRAILTQKGNPLGPNAEELSKPVADALCQFLPGAVVNQLLLGR